MIHIDYQITSGVLYALLFDVCKQSFFLFFFNTYKIVFSHMSMQEIPRFPEILKKVLFQNGYSVTTGTIEIDGQRRQRENCAILLDAITERKNILEILF